MISNFADSIIRSCITGLEGSLGSRLRYWYYKPKLKACKGYFTTGADVRLEGCENISIGSNVSFNAGVWINASCGVSIGDYSIIGPYCIIRDANHGYADISKPIRLQENSVAPVRIGDNVWLGASVVVLKGVSIGGGSIIAAHSLVNKPVPPMEVWGGVPARRLKSR